MANIFVGFHDRKSCNRILKPPGGGTSDIFNTAEEHAVVKTPSPAKIVEPDSPFTKNATGDQENNQENGRTEESKEQNGADELKIASLSVAEDDAEKEEIQKADVKIERSSTTTVVTRTKSDTLSSIVHDSEVLKEQKKTCPEKKPNTRVPPGGYSSGLW